MLDPQNRGALLEALRPPSGYVVDAAIATTYSLDLIALLTAPLAFSLYDRLADRDSHSPTGRLDSFALLHAVRKHAERLVVFCQAGAIHPPAGYRQLINYLEDAVVQVTARSDSGLFHPKCWIQRFTGDDGPVRYRLLCLSRNLTFDRSWDTMLTVEGELQERQLAIGDSRPLGEFVSALPGLMVKGEILSDSRRALVATMADELRRVRFLVPEGFDAMRFWPLGHAAKTPDPFAETRIERMLVVAPFLSGSRLEHLAKAGKNHVLVSRIDELAAQSAAVLGRFSEVHVLQDAAEQIDDADAGGTANNGRGPIPASRGLHAKLYVADDGWNAHMWTGSANATEAGFRHNVELLIQLTAKKAQIGVDAMLGQGTAGLRALLAPFVAPPEPVTETARRRAIDELLRLGNLAIATAPWSAKVERTSDEQESYSVNLALREGTFDLPAGCSARAWPLALQRDRGVLLASDGSATFERCSFQALTAFFAFELRATEGTDTETCEFVVKVALEGAPGDRQARLLQSLLDDPAKVLRFLRLLLSLDAFEALELLDPSTTEHATSSGRQTVDDAVPLFESLVRTLDREPHRLVEVERVVRELRASEKGAKLLPPDFDDLWVPLWGAYQALPQARRPT